MQGAVHYLLDDCADRKQRVLSAPVSHGVTAGRNPAVAYVEVIPQLRCRLETGLGAFSRLTI
jgi:hypothetical protein